MYEFGLDFDFNKVIKKYKIIREILILNGNL